MVWWVWWTFSRNLKKGIMISSFHLEKVLYKHIIQKGHVFQDMLYKESGNN